MWLQDLKLAVRLLARGRGFTAAALAVIALATGASSAVYSLVYSVVLRPLPFPAPDQLVSITQFYPAFKENVVTAPVYFDWVDGASNLAVMAAYSVGEYTLAGGDEAEGVSAARVSPEFFDCLGARSDSGRTFAGREDGAIVVSRSFWNGRARRDSLELDGRLYRVIGEMPASFNFPPGARLWMPLGLDAARERSGGPVEMVRVIARRKPGVTDAGLTAALAGISARVRGFSAGGRPLVLPLRAWLTGKTQRVWFLLLGVVGVVLLVACTNVAGLLMARGAARRGEMAVRIAIGAPLWRLTRQLLTESLVLAMAGSALGPMLGAVLLQAFLPLIPDGMLAGRPVALDGPVFGCTAATAIGIALLFGVAPARDALRTEKRRPVELRSVLAAAEVALSLVLLAGAALLVRSFAAVTAVDPGFRTDHRLSFTINPPAVHQYEFAADVLARLQALPGVQRATLISSLPFSASGGGFAMVSAEGEAPWGAEDALRHRVDSLFLGAAYFRTMGTPVLEGREFTAGEMTKDGLAVMVNRAFARRYFGGGSAVGKRIKVGYVESPEQWRTIVGVAADSKRGSLEEDTAPALYRPYLQRPTLRTAGVIVEAQGDAARLAPAVRRIAAAWDVETLETRLDRSVAPQKLRTVSASLLALLALAMTAAGLYGVLSYLVAQRTREIGVRMALGAAPRDILRLVLRRSGTLALAGITAGVPLSLAASQSLRGLLFGVSAADPWILAGAAGIMAGLAIAASLGPARRAVRIDPMRCLREE